MIELVKSFKYLGSIIDQTAETSHEIRASLGVARTALKSLDTLWRDRALPKRIKLKLIKTLVWTVALYGVENRTLRASEISKLRSFEMACFRRMLGIRWTDHRTNESILQELGVQKELVNIVRERKLKYFGHVVRAQNLSTHILEGKMNGRRPRGRPRRRWIDDIKEWTGRTMAACTRTARRRRDWRSLVRESRIPDPQQ